MALTLVNTLTTTQNALRGSCIDKVNNVLYFFPYNNGNSGIVKIPLNTFTQTAVSANLSNCEVSATYGFDGSSYIYFSPQSNVSWVNTSNFTVGSGVSGGFRGPLADTSVEFSANNLGNPPVSAAMFRSATNNATLIAQDSHINTQGNFLWLCGLDKINSFVYYCDANTNLLYKYSYTASTINLVTTVTAGGVTYNTGIIDTTNHFAYFWGNNGNIVKYDVSGNNLTLVGVVGNVGVAPNIAGAACLDLPNGHMYFGGAGTVYRLNLNTQTFDQSYVMPVGGANSGVGASYDVNGFIYVTDSASPSVIYKLQATADPPTVFPSNAGAGSLKKPPVNFDWNRISGGF